jgi:hypothetical protein
MYNDECAKYIENLKAHMVTIHERMHPLDN